GGDDASHFTIGSTSGALAFTTPPDYENPQDANADNVYLVLVQVSDGSLVDQQLLYVTVTNVNEYPPIAFDDNYQMNKGDALQTHNPPNQPYGLLYNDIDPDGDPLHVTRINGATLTPGQALTLPSGATLVVATDGTFTYTPPLSLEGQDSFQYTVSDGLYEAT